MIKIHFCTPCYGGQISEMTFSSYLNFTISAMKNDIPFVIDTISNESNINRGRNTLAAKFLSGDCSHLMFVDADIGFSPQHVLMLAEHDLEVVGGVYPQKTLPTKHVVNTIDNGEINPPLVEVGTIGTGFLLIKRQVFERLVYEKNMNPYTDNIGLPENEQKNQYDFFRTSVDSNNRYMTEDWTFCRDWRSIGGKIWADLRIDLVHTGHFRFPPNLSDLRERYGIKAI